MNHAILHQQGSVGIGDTVTRLLDLTITSASDGQSDFADMAGFALRNNPRRAHLIVSRVLGKHIPVAPSLILSTGHALADAVREVSTEHFTETALALGYCETATGLGHAVAEGLGITYLHTTRKEAGHLPVAARFEEEHSHAVAHLIQPEPHLNLAGTGPLVLIDDELTTGKTALNTIAELHALFPRPGYVIATILDARTPEGRVAFEARAAEMGVQVRVASLVSAYLSLPEDVLDRAATARAALAAPAPIPSGPLGHVTVHDNLWPTTLAGTARHGMIIEETHWLNDAADAVALLLLPALADATSILVLGTEELLHMPTRVAAALDRNLAKATVLNQSTTRSPVHAANDPGYAIRRTVEFAAPDDATRQSLVHNLFDPTIEPVTGEWSDLRHDAIVVIVDADATACASMVEALRPFADRIHLVTIPSSAR